MTYTMGDGSFALWLGRQEGVSIFPKSLSTKHLACVASCNLFSHAETQPFLFLTQRSKEAGRDEVTCLWGLANCHLFQVPNTPQALFSLALTKTLRQERSSSTWHKEETEAQRGQVTELVPSTDEYRPLAGPTPSLTPAKMREEGFFSSHASLKTHFPILTKDNPLLRMC